MGRSLLRKAFVVATAGLPMALSMAQPAAACLCVPAEGTPAGGKGLVDGPFCTGPAQPTEHGLAKAMDKTDVITGCIGAMGGLMMTVQDGGPPSGDAVDQDPAPPTCEVVTD